jgi:sec-independent protein translocase protein TatC
MTSEEALETDPANAPEGAMWVNLPKREVRVLVGGEVLTVHRLSALQSGLAIRPEIRVSEYYMFILQMTAAFGLGFQVPVVVSFLAVVGMASARDMSQSRRYVWFGMAVVAAVITPPDIASMVFLLGPMVLLYELGLWLARRIEKARGTPA